ncbi:MAG: FAD-dependent monooxygenase [Chloroflexi bacterium]|nr:FAD-dependent monooxygenase [Chloroflexota bacterium]
MGTKSYDIITLGGGLAGLALAKGMAEHGASVLVLESQTRFRDRVRGELMWPWGTAELVKLGIYDLLMDAGGHRVPWLDVYRGPKRMVHRDLVNTTTPGLPSTTFYHPQMQEVLSEAARAAGAEVRLGARVRGIRQDTSPVVVADIEGQEVEVKARLVVGADGRTSSARKWGGFKVQRDPDQIMIAGLLFDDLPVPDDAAHIFPYSKFGLSVLFFPQGHGRVRAYFCYPAERGYRLTGKADIQRFIEESLKTGVPAEYYAKARAAGPLATFSGAHTWVDHPYRCGVALIGDAAAAADPAHGQGLSKTVRDARVLRDKLLAHEDWDEAGHAYAEEHDRYYGINHTMESWASQMLFETGPEADARRGKAIPKWPKDPTRLLEPFYSGPDQVLDEAARKRFYGEE